MSIAAVWLALGMAVRPPSPASAEQRSEARLDAAYEVTLLGIPIGRIAWTVELRGNRFSASASGVTSGLLRFFSRGHGVAKSHGLVAARKPVATGFMVSYVAGRSADEVRIAFNGGKAREHLAHPPPPNPSLIPLTEASRIDVVDPMTALLVEAPGDGNAAVPAACDRKIRVFDGRMRYDLTLSFKRMTTVRAQTGYHGPVVVCAISFSPLAGYDPHRSAIKYLRAERGMEIWLAPIAGTRLLAPFRISVPTPIGLGALQAIRFESAVLKRSAAAHGR